MTLKDVKDYARTKGVKSQGTKMDIIRAIQTAEGFMACFGTRPAAGCQELSCLWRQDCLQQVQV